MFNELHTPFKLTLRELAAKLIACINSTYLIKAAAEAKARYLDEHSNSTSRDSSGITKFFR
jgi:hypothetical protein